MYKEYCYGILLTYTIYISKHLQMVSKAYINIHCKMQHIPWMKLFSHLSNFFEVAKCFYCRHFNMELIEGGQILNCSGNYVDVSKAYKNKKVLAYYFSASWCMPCKQLLPKLKLIYKESKRHNCGLEIIYVSSDTELPVMLKYFKERHGGWYALPFGDISETFRRMYGVTYIPQIIVVKEDGNIISNMGVKDINQLGVNVLVAWNPNPI